MNDYQKELFLKEVEVLSLELEKETLIDLILAQQDLIKEYKKGIALQQKMIRLLKAGGN